MIQTAMSAAGSAGVESTLLDAMIVGARSQAVRRTERSPVALARTAQIGQRTILSAQALTSSIARSIARAH